MLTENHEIQIEFNDDWEAFAWPIVGRELYFNVDFDDGIFTFDVAYSSGYHESRHFVDNWLNNVCERFLFDGVVYSSINDVSLAMWKYEIKLASNDERAIDDVLECVGPFYNEIQAELYAKGVSL